MTIGVEQCDGLSRKGNLLPYKNQVVYGVQVGFGVEYILGRKWSIALEPWLSYLIRTQFDNVKVSANIGLNYYF